MTVSGFTYNTTARKESSQNSKNFCHQYAQCQHERQYDAPKSKLVFYENFLFNTVNDRQKFIITLAGRIVRPQSSRCLQGRDGHNTRQPIVTTISIGEISASGLKDASSPQPMETVPSASPAPLPKRNAVPVSALVNRSYALHYIFFGGTMSTWLVIRKTMLRKHVKAKGTGQSDQQKKAGRRCDGQLEAAQTQLRQAVGTKSRLERQMGNLDSSDPYAGQEIWIYSAATINNMV